MFASAGMTAAGVALPSVAATAAAVGGFSFASAGVPALAAGIAGAVGLVALVGLMGAASGSML